MNFLTYCKTIKLKKTKFIQKFCSLLKLLLTFKTFDLTVNCKTCQWKTFDETYSWKFFEIISMKFLWKLVLMKCYYIFWNFFQTIQFLTSFSFLLRKKKHFICLANLLKTINKIMWCFWTTKTTNNFILNKTYLFGIWNCISKERN